MIVLPLERGATVLSLVFVDSTIALALTPTIGLSEFPCGSTVVLVLPPMMVLMTSGNAVAPATITLSAMGRAGGKSC